MRIHLFILYCFILLLIPPVHAQNQEEMAIKKTIATLFNAMQKGDTALMHSYFDKDARLQTALFNAKTGGTTLITEPLDSFLAQVIRIHSDTLNLEERITHYDIKVDVPMASVWADYEFYMNGKLVHTGVDAFQLFKSSTGWKIIQICETGKLKSIKLLVSIVFPEQRSQKEALKLQRPTSHV